MGPGRAVQARPGLKDFGGGPPLRPPASNKPRDNPDGTATAERVFSKEVIQCRTIHVGVGSSELQARRACLEQPTRPNARRGLTRPGGLFYAYFRRKANKANPLR